MMITNFSRISIVLALSASSVFASATSSTSEVCPAVDVVNTAREANPNVGKRFKFNDNAGHEWIVYPGAEYRLSALLTGPIVSNSRDGMQRKTEFLCHYTCREAECAGKSAVKIVSIRDRIVN